MTRMTILHETRYDYDRPVGFGSHRLLIRPRDSHSMRVVQASLQVTPPGEIRWVYDALGNCVCLFQPRGASTSLVITSRLEIERFPAPLTDEVVSDPRTAVPVVYDREDRTVVAPFMEPVTDDPDATLLSWVRGLVEQTEEPALDFALRVNKAIHQGFTYQARGAEGCQSPTETLAWRSGTCRDFAWLMVEALRRLGFAARFVTGYLYSPALDVGGSSALRGAGAATDPRQSRCRASTRSMTSRNASATRRRSAIGRSRTSPTASRRTACAWCRWTSTTVGSTGSRVASTRIR